MRGEQRQGASPGQGLGFEVVRGAILEAQGKMRPRVRCHLSGNGQATEDILQRFVVRALERGHELRDPNCVFGWLRKVLASVLADHGRELLRRPEYQGNPDTVLRAVAATAPEDPEWSCACMALIIETLRPDQAALICRLDLADEPAARLCIELGIVRNALHVRHHRARRALADLLKSAWATCPEERFFHCACPRPPDVQRARSVACL